MSRLLDIKSVADRICFSRSWIRLKVKESEFPTPVVKWGKSLWREEDIDEWIERNVPLVGLPTDPPVELGELLPEKLRGAGENELDHPRKD
jgi:predicted DNA-binding transcriptional regulator AlpA